MSDNHFLNVILDSNLFDSLIVLVELDHLIDEALKNVPQLAGVKVRNEIILLNYFIY